VSTAPKKDERRAVFRAYLAANELVEVIKANKREGLKLLDIGGAFGIHARYFRRNVPNLRVDVIDTVPANEPLIFTGQYDQYHPTEKYDYIWASHVLEHIPNPGAFFEKLHFDLKDGGWAGITVPPLKHDVSFAHVTLWNAGLLLVHFILAGFDCSNAHVATYGYNVSVLAQKRPLKGTKQEALPPSVKRYHPYFEGEIRRANWRVKAPSFLAPLGFVANEADTAVAAAERGQSGFFLALDKSGGQSILYYDGDRKEMYPAG